MENKNKQYTIVDFIANTTVESVVQIAMNHNFDFCSKKAATYLKDTKERMRTILDEMMSDAKDADFFGQIESGKVSPLVAHASQISLKHECIQWAKDCLIAQGCPIPNDKTTQDET